MIFVPEIRDGDFADFLAFADFWGAGSAGL